MVEQYNKNQVVKRMETINMVVKLDQTTDWLTKAVYRTPRVTVICADYHDAKIAESNYLKFISKKNFLLRFWWLIFGRVEPLFISLEVASNLASIDRPIIFSNNTLR